MRELDTRELEKTIGVKFRNFELLREALTHRSFLNENPDSKLKHNERLEYLGDAVLELVVSEELFRRSEKWLEGQLTVFRAALVNYQMLARIAQEIGLDGFILMSRGEAKDKGKAREVILANAFEALVGAMHLDQGLDAVRLFAEKFVLRHLDEVLQTKSYRDPKSELQEMTQEKLKITPTYKVLGEEGPAHKRTFRVGAYVGEECIAEGEGSSKQEAELDAAKAGLKKYKRH